MIKHKFTLVIAVLFLSMMIIMPAIGQVEDVQEENVAEEGSGDQGGGIMDTLLKAVGSAAQESLQEGIEDFIGTYKGRIGEVKLLKRQGNAVVLEVKYEGVKRKDGVYVQAEVLQWGEPLEGFSYTVSTLRDKRGSVNLTIGWQAQEISGWGISSGEQVVSDQLRLSLVRETNPDRPFGTLMYDFAKTWTNSSDIEIPEEMTDSVATGTEDAIELAEGETEEGQTSGAGTAPTLQRPVLILPGAVLAPGQVTATQPPPPTAHVTSSGIKPSPPTSTQPTSQAAGSSTKPMLNTTLATSMVYKVSNYNLYENAQKAQWRSAAGVLSCPGSANDNRGFVRLINESMICPNNKAMNLLQTHPQWANGGWIEGRYPVMTLGNNVKFKSVGAMLKGANSSDGVLMEVTVLDNGRHNRVIRKRINCRGYTNFEADLSKWAGKKVQILLRVSTGKTSTQDWAVWVNPRLENK